MEAPVLGAHCACLLCKTTDIKINERWLKRKWPSWQQNVKRPSHNLKQWGWINLEIDFKEHYVSTQFNLEKKGSSEREKLCLTLLVCTRRENSCSNSQNHFCLEIDHNQFYSQIYTSTGQSPHFQRINERFEFNDKVGYSR